MQDVAQIPGPIEFALGEVRRAGGQVSSHTPHRDELVGQRPGEGLHWRLRLWLSWNAEIAVPIPPGVTQAAPLWPRRRSCRQRATVFRVLTERPRPS